MGSASITIAVNGKWNGTAIESALKTMNRLSVQTAALESSSTSSLAKMGADWAELGGSIYNAGKKIESVGEALTKSVTVPLVALGAYAVSAATTYDSAMADLRKTTDLTEEELEEFGEAALEVSTTQPVTADTILQIEALGAQLGVADDALEDFADTSSGLDIATDMDWESAATSLQQYSNIMGTANDEFSNLGSTIVALGNNSATTESSIMTMATRLASAGEQAGMSEAEVLGISAAMSSLGIASEAGGSAMSKTIVNISKAVATGSDDLQAYAEVAGMTAEEFAQAWEEDATGALVSFIDGIAQLDEAGQDVNVTLEELDITELRQSDTLRRLVGNTDLLKESVDLANTAWEENTALTQEVEDRNQSLESRLQVLMNKVNEIAVTFGVPFTNALIAAADAAEPLISAAADAAQAFADMDEEGQQQVVTLALVAAAAGPVLTATGKLVQGYGNVVTAAGRAAQQVAVYGDALDTVDGSHIRNYASSKTLAAQTGVLNNAYVKAAGGAEEAVRSFEALYSAQKSNESISSKLAKAEEQLAALTGDTTKKAQKKSEALQKNIAALEEQREANNLVIETETDLQKQWKKTAGIADDVTDAVDGAADSAKGAATASKTLGTGLTTLKNGATLAGAALKSLALSIAPMLAIAAVGAAVAYVAEQMEEAAQREEDLAEASRSVDDILGELSSSAGAAASAVGEYALSLDDVASASDAALQSAIDLNDEIAETWGDVETSSDAVDRYVATIDELANKSGLSAEEQANLVAAVEGYNEVVGTQYTVTDAANGKIADETGTLVENTDAIHSNADAWERNARVQAATSLMNQAIEDQTEAAYALADAQEYLNQLKEEDADITSMSVSELIKYNGKLSEAQEAVEDAQAAYDSASDKIEYFTGQVALASSALGDDFMAAVESLPQSLQTAGVDIATSLASGIESSAVTAEDAMRFMTEGVEGVVAGLPAYMQDAGADAAQSLADQIAAGEMSVDEAVAILSAAAAGGLDTLPEDMQSKGTDAVTALNASIAAGSDGALTAATGVKDAAVSGVSSLSSDYSTTGSTAGTSLATALSGKSGSVSTASTSLDAAAKKGVSGTAASLSSAGSTAGSNFATGVGSAKGSTSSAGTSLADAAKAADANRSNATTWGSHLGTNFGSGIASAVSWVTQQASKLASAAASVLKFSVPDEGPFSGTERGGWTSGYHLGQNIASGMEAAAPLISSAADSLMRAASLGASVPLNGYAAAGGSNVTNNYSVTIGGVTYGAAEGSNAAALIEALMGEFTLTAEMGGK